MQCQWSSSDISMSCLPDSVYPSSSSCTFIFCMFFVYFENWAHFSPSPINSPMPNRLLNLLCRACLIRKWIVYKIKHSNMDWGKIVGGLSPWVPVPRVSLIKSGKSFNLVLPPFSWWSWRKCYQKAMKTDSCPTWNQLCISNEFGHLNSVFSYRLSTLLTFGVDSCGSEPFPEAVCPENLTPGLGR